MGWFNYLKMAVKIKNRQKPDKYSLLAQIYPNNMKRREVFHIDSIEMA
jgi:hypothetical protein